MLLFYQTFSDSYQLVPFEPESDFLVRRKSPESHMASEPASGSATSADVGQQEPQATLKRRSQEQMQTNAAEPRMKDYEFNL